MSGVTLETIVKAKHNNSIIKNTPLERNTYLSEIYNANIDLKREDLSPVRSYKVRGAFNYITEQVKNNNKDFVCASAGNHAQGVALTCNHYKVNGVIFMPTTTPLQKIYKVRKFGGEYIDIIITGDTFDDAFDKAIKYTRLNKKTFVHPFNEAAVISGQGTVGLEILSECKNHIDYIVVPVGGGGLISGICVYFKNMSPDTKIIGVEPQGAPSMSKSIEQGKVVVIDKIDTFVDGAAVKRVGDLNFAIANKDIDQMITVPEGRVCTTMLDLLYHDGIVTEPAGALAIDALKDLKEIIINKTVVCVLSGGNFDFERLPEVKERSLIYEGLKHYLIVNFAQRAGTLREFLDVLGPDDDITRFEYIKKTSKEKGPALVGIELKNPNDFQSIIDKMNKKKIKYEKVTSNSLLFDLII